MTDENANSVSSRRRTWRIAGAVMWLCVGLALFGMWLSRRSDHVAAQTEADEEPAKVIRVETGADGTVRLNESDGKPPKPIWDPNGVEDFSFTNCDGRTIAKRDLLGQPWVAAFVFTHCLGPCPLITKRMRELQDRFQDEDFHLVTFTVDPDRDTPEALKTYAELNGADLNRWYFLWGKAVDVYGLIHRSFLMPVMDPRRESDDPGKNYQVIHSNQLLLVDQQGVVRGKFNGEKDEDAAALARELRRLLHPPRTSSASGAAATETTGAIPDDAWYMTLPAVNAGLNGLATLLLGWGFVLIKQGRRNTHRNVMLTAFAVSIAFLACYVLYHAALHYNTGLAGKKFEGSGPARPVYFTILISHVLLAMTVPVLASITIYRGLKADWAKHRRIAKITWPIWMYVSVTGVIIYGMLYHWPTGASG